MKTNLIAARLRVERLPEYSQTQKDYIISLLAEQAAKVFEGMLKENDELYTLSHLNPEEAEKETEFAMIISIERPAKKRIENKKRREFLKFLVATNKLISDKIAEEIGADESKGNKSNR